MTTPRRLRRPVPRRSRLGRLADVFGVPLRMLKSPRAHENASTAGPYPGHQEAMKRDERYQG